MNRKLTSLLLIPAALAAIWYLGKDKEPVEVVNQSVPVLSYMIEQGDTFSKYLANEGLPFKPDVASKYAGLIYIINEDDSNGIHSSGIHMQFRKNQIILLPDVNKDGQVMGKESKKVGDYQL